MKLKPCAVNISIVMPDGDEIGDGFVIDPGASVALYFDYDKGPADVCYEIDFSGEEPKLVRQ